MTPQKIETVIIQSLQELNDVLDNKIVGPVLPQTRIFGRKGVLDSMGLVTLITDLEEKLEQEFGYSLILADDRAMSQEKSPFRSVGSLAEYISVLIDEQTGSGKT
jgi:acyl carrier protein